MVRRFAFLVVPGLLAAASGASGQGNEFVVHVKSEAEGLPLDGSGIAVSRAFGKAGYFEIAQEYRAQLDRVADERLTLEMLASGDVLGRLGLEVPQGAKYVALGVCRVHEEAKLASGLSVANATLTLRVVEVESTRVVFSGEAEGKGQAATFRQAAIDADAAAGAKMAERLPGALAVPAPGNWFGVRVTYADRLAGLRALQRIQESLPIDETTRTSGDETSMYLKMRSPLAVGEFQIRFERFVLETFPGAKVDFARNVFNVHLDPDALADPLAHCEEADGPAREPAAEVEATGYGVLEGDAVDRAREEALAGAFRAAVERGVHVWIDASTVVENFQVVEERIFTQARGFVESHEVLEEGKKDEGTWFVRIRARVKHGDLRERLDELDALQSRIGRPKVAVVYDWMGHDPAALQPAGPLHEPRVLRPTDVPAAGAVVALQRFLQSKRFAVHDAAALRRSLARMKDAREIGADEAAVLDLLDRDDFPVDLVLLATVWSEGVARQGDRSLVSGRVQVQAWLAATQQLLGTRIRRASRWIAGDPANPARELSVLAEETACQLARDFWPELRGSLEEEKRFEVFLRNFGEAETAAAILALEKVRGVRAVVRNRIAPRFASLTVYGIGALPYDRFADAARLALTVAAGRAPTFVLDRQTLVFSFETYFEDPLGDR